MKMLLKPPALAILLSWILSGSCSAQTTWENANTRWLIGPAASHLQYDEADTLGLVSHGALDTERGAMAGGMAQLRWMRGARGDSVLPPFLLDIGLEHDEGSTAYRGYLQAGRLLTPFHATTHNRFTRASLRVGLPIQLGAPLQLVPYVGYGSERWTRNLTQYGERFCHDSAALGLLTQTKVSGTLLAEVDLALGTIINAEVQAQSLGFSSRLPGKRQSRVAATIGYTSPSGVLIQVMVLDERLGLGQSPASAGFVEPASRTRFTRLVVSVGHQL